MFVATGYWHSSPSSPPDQHTMPQPGVQKLSQTFLPPTCPPLQLTGYYKLQGHARYLDRGGRWAKDSSCQVTPSDLPNCIMTLSSQDGDGWSHTLLGVAARCSHLTLTFPMLISRPYLGPEGGSSQWVGAGRRLNGLGCLGMEEWALKNMSQREAGRLWKVESCRSQVSKSLGHVLLSHEASLTKCKFKDKTIKNFSTASTEH